MKTLTKKIQRSEDLFVQFTPEELKDLNIKEGDKFSWEITKEGVSLKKFATLDIDISDWSREVLEMIIVKSLESDKTVNEVICDLIDSYINNYRDI